MPSSNDDVLNRMPTHAPSRRRRSLGALAAIMLIAGAAAACSTAETDTDDEGAESSEDAIESSDQDQILLRQGWTPADRESWTRLSDGSGLVPIPWLAAVEVADSDAMFLDDANVKRFGFLPARKSVSNPFGLPIGWSVQNRGLGPMPMAGSNCAGCHEAQVTYRGKTIRVQGGQGVGKVSDFSGAAYMAIGATLKTLETPDHSKFDRFAARVFTITKQAATFTGPDAEAKKQAAVQQLIAALQQVLTKVAAGAAYDREHGIDSKGWGPYRTDAVQRAART